MALQGGSFTQGPTSAQVNPQGYQTPYGGISFTAQVPQAGGTLTVTLTFPQDLPQGAVLLKCTSSTACNPIQGAQIQGRTATFQVRDGGPLDADGQANGRIQDPVALGVPAPSPDFSIALNPDALTVPQGGSGTTTLTLTPQNGFTGQVTLTLERQDGTPAPSGIGLSPGSVNVTGSGPVTQTLTVSVGSSVATGSYALRVKATSGDLTRYANLSLQVTTPEPLGVLDEAFGTGGKVLLDLEPGYAWYDEREFHMRVRPNGKIVVVGNRSTTDPNGYIWIPFAVAQFNPDGTLDTTFANGGMYVRQIGTGQSTRVHGADLAPDGGVLVLTSARLPYPLNNPCPSTSVDYPVLAKIGESGNEVWLRPIHEVVVRDDRGTPNPCDDVLWYNIKPVALRIDAEGRILVGLHIPAGTYSRNLIMRFLPDGALDPAFGNNGLAEDEPRGNNERDAVIALQPDGKILVGGVRGQGFQVLRYLPDGNLDIGFGSGGRALIDPLSNSSEIAWDLLVQGDGKILVAFGTGSNKTGICRLNPDGTQDTIFRCDIVHINSGARTFGALALQPNGKVLLLAWDLYAFEVYRLLAENGSTEVHWTFSFGGNRASGYAIAYLEGLNRILMGGIADNGSNPDYALIRLK
ncbi:hypothetical protein Thermus77311_24390 [Thermus antranikianii]